MATFLPEGGGYAGFMHGNVVDMFYCPIIRFDWPAWVPFGLAGRQFEFFSPVFNIADASITAGVISILVFQKKFFGKGDAASSQSPVTSETDMGTGISGH